MKSLITITLLTVSVFSTDYSSMSIDELSNLRGSVPVEERASFKEAWQNKTQYMSPDEQMKYMQRKNENNTNGKGTMTRQRLRDGSGSGGMYKGSRSGNGGGGGGRR